MKYNMWENLHQGINDGYLVKHVLYIQPRGIKAIRKKLTAHTHARIQSYTVML